MFKQFKREVETALKKAIEDAGYRVNDLELGISPFADLATTVCYRIASSYKVPPDRAAKKIVEAMDTSDMPLIGEVKASGPYINFYTSDRFLTESLRAILKGDLGFESKDEVIILEHTSANPDGPLHIGHIRNTVIGDTLARILRRAGMRVEVEYYVNDMGRQAALVVLGLERFELDRSKKIDHAIADVYVKANRLIEENPELKSEVDQLIRRYEEGDEEVTARFREAVILSLEGIRQSLLRLGVDHDLFVWESDFVRTGDVSKIISWMKEDGSIPLVEKEGALMLDLSEAGFDKEFVLCRSDGTSIYATRDLAYHRFKARRGDRVIDVFGADHKLISSQLSYILGKMGVKKPEIVIFEFVSLPEGSMSTREGKFISCDELIDEVEARARIEVDKRRGDLPAEKRAEIARAVARGAIRYDIVKVSPEKPTVFDWDKALDFEKQSAPYLQYAHARCCSILRKVGGWDVREEEISAIPLDLLRTDQEIKLIKMLSKFSYIIEEAARTLKPNLLATYAKDLVDSFNLFYRDCPVLNAEDDLRKARLALVEATRIILSETLETLGIEALEEM
ncbi:MAG TPA: arginine--tRNA ligase [Candidatus Syntrophoarchaeum butanivorans]|uniref:Arginine--tRNA ligase n=1 Tax=Candidatus Syntropharchaeum butanivorans TaxID=1839936 RepID=A0A1F2P397_9EURY|nr:MAG: arginyl-tRNA ligase [Candidatus Syntrophoarchaeum butanivorans]HEC57724.1 arginine--tRNA ligase [Candidatus Syntrophoarchaeum butanivorans]